jgi:pyrimidine operon attenuation protein / uracil phosphoribosyltransferase
MAITAVEVFSAKDVAKSITRIAHEILERHADVAPPVLIGIQSGGTWIAELIKADLDRIKPGNGILCGAIDAAMHRDDIGIRPVLASHTSSIPTDLSGATVILVDDVLFTGRTVRAALEALNEYGRPQCVQLAVLVDRGHRELPIRPDYVGKNIPTKISDEVNVSVDGVLVEAR